MLGSEFLSIAVKLMLELCLKFVETTIQIMARL